MNLAQYLFEHTASLRTDVVSGPGETLSYAKLYSGVNRLSAYMMQRFDRQERIGLLAHNSPFFLVAYLATVKSGCVAVMLDANAATEKISAEIARARVSCVFAGDGAAQKLASLQISTIEERLFAAILEQPVSDDVKSEWRGDGDDLAVVFFTSGTMADRKGVMLSHSNIIANTESINGYLAIAPSDRSCVVLPLHYAGGTAVLHTHMRVGASLVLYNTTLAGSIIDGINRYGCTNLAGVPTTYSILLRRGGFLKHRYPTLRFVAQAGGAMAESMIRELREGLPPEVDVFIMYGQTEAAARLAYVPPSRLSEKIGSIGRAIPGVELRVVNEDGHDVPVGLSGELVARGDNVMLGYLDDPVATMRVLRDGWLHTNDLATVDEEGFIHVLGRMDDVIKCAGHRVSPEEVESAILSYPRVAQCAVVGVKDRFLGEAIVAYIGAEKADAALEQEIRSLCGDKLPHHMRPKYIEISESLPLNSSLKLDRAALRRRASQQFG